MNLKQYRIDKKMTQAQLAKECNCDRSMIGKVENGEVKPSVKLAKAIACVLGIDWTSFYEDVEPSKKGA